MRERLPTGNELHTKRGIHRSCKDLIKRPPHVDVDHPASCGKGAIVVKIITREGITPAVESTRELGPGIYCSITLPCGKTAAASRHAGQPSPQASGKDHAYMAKRPARSPPACGKDTLWDEYTEYYDHPCSVKRHAFHVRPASADGDHPACAGVTCRRKRKRRVQAWEITLLVRGKMLNIDS